MSKEEDDKWMEIFSNAVGTEYQLEDRDYLYRLLHTIDWDMQVLATTSMLRRNSYAADAFQAEIAESHKITADYDGPYHEHYVDEHVYLLQQSVYTSAATSMAAIGMIAPMLESVFSEAFRELGSMYKAKAFEPPDHERWERSDKEDKNRWNVQYYFGTKKNRTDIYCGLHQLAKATNFYPFLDEKMWQWIKAMFRYRNFMFHNGFEWPQETRQKFSSQITDQNWDSYFTCSKSGGDPWIFYLSDEAIADIPNQMDKILDGLAKFAKSLPFELVCIE